jgi:putative membrane protein
MNPNPPWGEPQDGGPSSWMLVHHESWWMGMLHLLPLLLLAVLIAVIVWGVLHLTSRGAPMTAAVGPPSVTAHDRALEELRVRYARGEVDRTDYLERSADLGGREIPDAPADLGPPPADQE